MQALNKKIKKTDTKKQAAFNGGKTRVSQRTFVFDGADYTDMANGPDVKQDCYAKIQLKDANLGTEGGLTEVWTTGVTEVT